MCQSPGHCGPSLAVKNRQRSINEILYSGVTMKIVKIEKTVKTRFLSTQNIVRLLSLRDPDGCFRNFM